MFSVTQLLIWNLQVIGYYDTDVAEYLYKSKPDIDSVFNFLCKDLTKACSTKPPPVPKVQWYTYTLTVTFYDKDFMRAMINIFTLTAIHRKLEPFL